MRKIPGNVWGYENNIHNCQYFDEDEINKKFNSISNHSFDLTDYHPLHFTVRDKQG